MTINDDQCWPLRGDTHDRDINKSRHEREDSKKIFIIGSTGRTGGLVAEQALSRGHIVTTMVRGPSGLGPHERLRVVIGDVLRADDLAQALSGQDVIISCLGQRSRSDRRLLQNAASAALAAMSRAGVCRYLVVSQGLLFPSRDPIVAVLRLLLKRHVADSSEMERRVGASAADWTIVRAPRLLMGGSQRGYRSRLNALPRGAMTLERADLAAFLLDLAESEVHKRQVVGVTSAPRAFP
ncbi:MULTISPECIES: NAD(P)-dependent oxidoreductase [unclassified Bradyrhizobium]|uniref:NAD(P)-dependent oxidoreductase n=1 Tax=unclassified Bradyrhizobium TaxID=2631580 RepID=UPI0028EB8984|nr:MULTISPECIES: NAD(P)H-binding protein [unclassified Bradyrhizobium]